METDKAVDSFAKELLSQVNVALCELGETAGPAREKTGQRVKTEITLSGVAFIVVWVVMAALCLAAWAYVVFHVAAFWAYLRHLIF